MKDAINVRADEKSGGNPKLTDKQMAVYFAYLIRSKRNPNAKEPYRYLYTKDINKTSLAKELKITTPTIRQALQVLEERNLMCFSADGKICWIPDSTIYSWIPIITLQRLYKIMMNPYCGGDLLRLYADIYYARDLEQEFGASTWVKVFGLSPKNSENYLKFHILLFVLKLYGFIDYEIKRVRAIGGKQYILYTNVKVMEVDDYVEIDEENTPLSAIIEEYTKTHKEFEEKVVPNAPLPFKEMWLQAQLG